MASLVEFGESSESSLNVTDIENLAQQIENELPVLEDVDEILLSCENQTDDSTNFPASQNLCQSDQIDLFHSYCLKPGETPATNVDHNSTSFLNIPLQPTNPPHFQEWDNQPIRPQDVPIYTNPSTPPLFQKEESLESRNKDIHVTADHSGVFDISFMKYQNNNVADYKGSSSNGREFTFPNIEANPGLTIPALSGQSVTGDLCRVTGSGGHSVDHSTRAWTHSRKRKREADDNEAMLPALEAKNKRLKKEEGRMRNNVEKLKSLYIRAIATRKIVFDC